MAETMTQGRRRAAVEVDAITEIATAEQRTAGRRASRAAAPVQRIEAPEPTHANYVGRRFDVQQRYGIAPTRQILATTLDGDNVVALPGAVDAVRQPDAASASAEFVSILTTERRKPSRAGFSHKVAAVAAVSGLALAAVAPQLAGQDHDEQAVAAAQRTATSAVVDVKAPQAVSELVVERAALKSDLNPNVAKEEKFAEVLTASNGNIEKISSTAGLLDAPVASKRITSTFGHRKNPTGPGYMIHSGTDYGVACGTQVFAAASGTVSVSGWEGHSGNRVTVDHGDGLQTGYSHNSKLLVNVGDKVKRGDLIALSGTTGNSTGCHVHFEVIVDGKFKDPAGWL